jgi:hypothetical protein
LTAVEPDFERRLRPATVPVSGRRWRCRLLGRSVPAHRAEIDPMQKTHPPRPSKSTANPPSRSCRGCYAVITRLLHTRRAVPIGRKSVIRTRRFSSPRCSNTAGKARPRALLPMTVQCVDERAAVVLALACPASGAVTFRDAASDGAVRQVRS